MTTTKPTRGGPPAPDPPDRPTRERSLGRDAPGVDYPPGPAAPGWSNAMAVSLPPEAEPELQAAEPPEPGWTNAKASRAEPDPPAKDNPMEIGWSNERAVRVED
jgi:hypothetical protein